MVMRNIRILEIPQASPIQMPYSYLLVVDPGPHGIGPKPDSMDHPWSTGMDMDKK